MNTRSTPRMRFLLGFECRRSRSQQAISGREVGLIGMGWRELPQERLYLWKRRHYCSRATADPLKKIKVALAKAKEAFRATAEAPWETPLYQYANCLAHLYFARQLNGLDAYLLFLYFAGAPDVPEPCSVEQCQGAARLIEKCLGLGRHL